MIVGLIGIAVAVALAVGDEVSADLAPYLSSVLFETLRFLWNFTMCKAILARSATILRCLRPMRGCGDAGGTSLPRLVHISHSSK